MSVFTKVCRQEYLIPELTGTKSHTCEPGMDIMDNWVSATGGSLCCTSLIDAAQRLISTFE